MRKTDGGALDGLGEIPRRWPVLRNGPGLCWRKRHYVMLRSLISIRMIARSSFLILPANRSSSKNRYNSSSHFVSKRFCRQPSPFSRRRKYHEATASDISNNTSPFSHLPESITTD